VDFQVRKSVLDKQRKSHSAEEISTLLGKKNKISVGIPEVWNLVDLLKEKKCDIPAEVKLMLDECDFYQIRLVCTFKPDKNCKFFWSRFGLKLYPVDVHNKSRHKTPVAYNLFPREIYQEVKVNRNFTIGPSFNYSFARIDAKSGRSEEFIRYDPEIISFGLLQSNAGWEFRKSKAKDHIIGDKELFMIIKAPKDVKIEATFEFSAEVYTFLGIVPMFPIKNYKGQLSRHHIEVIDHG
jgi:hypothetical protein